MTRYLNYLLSLILFLLLLKCAIDFFNKQIDLIDNYKWELIVSCPKFYAADNYQVSLLNKKKKGYAFVNSDDIEEWGGLPTDIDSNIDYKYVPDSLIVNWNCSVDMLSYELKTKLPREKMLQFFENPLKKEDGSIISYNKIVVGMAPGGNVTVWMRAVNVLTEIGKFKAENKGIYKEGDIEHQKSMNKFYKSKEFINSEVNIFRYFHGIPYKAWETGDKEYKYDIGFSSKEEKYSYDLTFNAKDGSWFSLNKFDSFIPWGEKEIRTGFIIQNKHKSPVQLDISWYTNEENYNDRQKYEGKIILPQNLENLLKSGIYKRLLINIEKDEHKDAVIGTLLLKGKNAEKKIMTFKLGRYDYKLDKQLSPEYIVPKGFIFPKRGKGKEPLTTPDVDYWQEK